MNTVPEPPVQPASYRRKLVTARIRNGGMSWGRMKPSLLHPRSDMPCPTITCPTWFSQDTLTINSIELVRCTTDQRASSVFRVLANLM